MENDKGAKFATFDPLTLEKFELKMSDSGTDSIGSGVCGGRFLNIDLGDDRAITCQIDGGTEWPIFSFKTLHAQEETNPAGKSFP